MAKQIINNSWYELPNTTGTIQNISNKNVPIEVSEEEVNGSGQVLYPKDAMSFSGTQLYARTTLANTSAEVRISPFAQAVGGGSSSGGTTYVLPTASASTKGGVKVGDGLKMAGAVLSADTGTAVGKIVKVEADGKIDSSLLPAIQLGDTYVVASQTDMLALSAKVGDVCVRTDEQKSYILQATPATTLSNWVYLESPTDAVQSVNGRTGVVNIAIPTKVSDLTNDSGFISSVPIATTTRLGGIKVGDNLTITSDGKLSAKKGIENWVASTAYAVNDLVINDNIIYQCITANSDATFDTAKWVQVSDCLFGFNGNNVVPIGTGHDAEISTGVDSWGAGVTYKANQLVYTNSKLYICQADHTAGADFATDLLSGKWKFIGNGVGSNVHREVIYTGTDSDIVTSTSGTSTFNASTSNLYDYYVCEIATVFGTTSGAINVVTIDTKSFSFSYMHSTRSSAGFIGVNGSVISFAVRKLENCTGCYIQKITGIKITELTTDYLASLSMPSGKYITLGTGTTNSTTWADFISSTAPNDGYIYILTSANIEYTSALLGLRIGRTKTYFIASSNNYIAFGRQPVKKGEPINLDGRCSSVLSVVLYFEYTQGAAKALGLI